MSQIRPTPFHYHARVTSAYDGDTCIVDIDLGLGVCKRGEKLHLHRICVAMSGPKFDRQGSLA